MYKDNRQEQITKIKGIKMKGPQTNESVEQNQVKQTKLQWNQGRTVA